MPASLAKALASRWVKDLTGFGSFSTALTFIFILILLLNISPAGLSEMPNLAC
jgi:hypothetical protein